MNEIQCRKFQFVEYDTDDERVDVEIPEVMNGDYGLYVWPSAPVLAQYVWKNRHSVRGKQVVELGAGTGLAGITAAKIGGLVTLSDACHLPNCLDRCHASIGLNGLEGKVKVIGISWGQFSPELLELGPVDLILGSDCFYDSKDFEAVLVTVAYLFEQNKLAEFWTTYQERSSKRSIEALLCKWKLTCTEIPLEEFGAKSPNVGGSNLPGDHVIHMFIIKHDYG